MSWSRRLIACAHQDSLRKSALSALVLLTTRSGSMSEIVALLAFLLLPRQRRLAIITGVSFELRAATDTDVIERESASACATGRGSGVREQLAAHVRRLPRVSGDVAVGARSAATRRHLHRSRARRRRARDGVCVCMCVRVRRRSRSQTAKDTTTPLAKVPTGFAGLEDDSVVFPLSVQVS
jgi:hypothetical protein